MDSLRPASTPLLQIKDLRTYFDTEEGVVKAVDGITYDIGQGETVALVGESGCGKSVSALSILQLIPSPPGRIVSGQVLFEGQDLARLRSYEIRSLRGRRIAIIFQEPMTSLNPVMNVETQLTEAMTLQLGLTMREARRRSVELLDTVGINDPERRVKQYPHEFSGGMRQRVMVAMALSCEPSLIIADEPTTALDVTIQAQILDLLQDLTRDRAMALLLITHNLGVVARYAHRINVMYAGRIVEQGTCLEIFGEPKHPYTEGLLESIPRMDRPKRSALTAISGLPPDLGRLPEGCHFRPRCRFAVERCAREYPPLQQVNGQRRSACWVAEDLASLLEARK
jgi:oligopeptide/dipeptide ABC transporter ATP-binding protein